MDILDSIPMSYGLKRMLAGSGPPCTEAYEDVCWMLMHFPSGSKYPAGELDGIMKLCRGGGAGWEMEVEV